MSKHGCILLLAAAVVCGCVMPQHDRASPPELTQPVSTASLGQECSALRADIASARYRQRTLPPTSNTPVIADAANAKVEQRIEAMRQRYESLGCAKVPPADVPARSP
jgi:hypothetical protein